MINTELKRGVELGLNAAFRTLGMDNPTNMETIIDFCAEDIKEAADEKWSDGDLAIALRRFIENSKIK